jgi:quercetin dioxygenase-like cupin family protein
MTGLAALPPDDGIREPSVAQPEDEALTHVAIGDGTYTILVRGEDTGDRYALIDMVIPAGGGPLPHRDDFEEMFHVLEGEVEVTIRGVTATAGAGATVNIPALAPHRFRNPTDKAVRVRCLAAPAGLEAYFAEVGDSLPTRTSSVPELTPDEIHERVQKANALAPKYGIEIL